MIENDDIEVSVDTSDDLRSEIVSAIEAQRAAAPPAPAPDEPVEAVEASEPEAKEAAPRKDGRDANGRFTAKDGGETAEEPQAKAAEPVEAAEPAKVEAPAHRPPPGFSVPSKAAWDQLPESVKADIAKREDDIASGLKRYEGLARYAEQAERNGTSLQNAVADYSQIESALRADFVAGVEQVCQRMGVDPRALAGAMARKYGGDSTNPGQQATQPPSVNPNAIVQQAVQAFRAEQEQRDLSSQVLAFENDPKNRFFANVRSDMAALVNAGQASTLTDAYEKACWLNPEIRAVLIKERSGGVSATKQAAVAQSRAAAKAVGGAPAPGFNPNAKANDHNLSLEDTIRARIAEQRGAA